MFTLHDDEVKRRRISTWPGTTWAFECEMARRFDSNPDDTTQRQGKSTLFTILKSNFESREEK
jgi:hypothetical protein